MNLPSLFRTFGVIILQIVTFFVSWSLMVKIARDLDRFPPALFFGIALYYGMIGMASLFVICGMVTAITKQARIYCECDLFRVGTLETGSGCDN